MTVAVPNVAPSGPPPAGDPAESLADLLARLGDVPPSSKERLPQGRIPDAAVPQLVPDLAVEVLSEGNTKKEMARKRGECFDAGVRLVWVVDPEALTVAVGSITALGWMPAGAAGRRSNSAAILA